MGTTPQAADEQARLWNGPVGQAWVDTQPVLDRMFDPLKHLLVNAVLARAPARVLDVGCGTGSTTLAIARRLGRAARCVGVDISDPMIAVARTRAARDELPADFICADAQTHAFEPGSFDLIVSRFGVMFFGDPVAAFANLRRAARADAGLQFVAWRSPAENAFMTAAERAAAPLLPDLPPRRPDAPGQFAFARADRVQAVLEESGWTAIHAEPIDVACTFAADDLVAYLTRLGPVGLALQDADEGVRQRVVEAVRPAFEPYVHGGEVRFTAACWSVSARAGMTSPLPRR